MFVHSVVFIGSNNDGNGFALVQQPSGLVKISKLPLELPDMSFFINVTVCDSANFGVLADVSFQNQTQGDGTQRFDGFRIGNITLPATRLQVYFVKQGPGG